VARSFSRAAVNYQSGARTQLSSILCALMIALTLLVFTSLFYYLPNAALAAVILIAVHGLLDLGEARGASSESGRPTGTPCCSRSP
jgi:SulP family sulfate permease